ncbi:CRISPR-associated helicase/endonuclease Cas3 [Paracoccus sp. J56]|uniref:CRISPR-associated helicase/endonuclease Cas3 n=1 Tax=Paracoccus sp. J56 TaxID=935850 RepID=UPI000A0DAAD1|nr:CRISPR-associated helicase/endonuclease Cas3 [Paracoccus sp. J56]SMG55464.1 CRISPR-associated helicase, Cas3 family [Paracoccus sp. J56]
MKILKHYAHTGIREDRSDWQLLADHLENTAALAAERAEPLGLRAAAHMAGLFHDFGKYDPAFDRILSGEKLRVDHSTAGAALLHARTPAGLRPVSEVIGYAILGHHAGLPDRHGADSSMERRFETFRDPIAPEISAAASPDFDPVARELAKLMRPASCGFDLSVAARMVFSCLVDADFRDTEAFYAGLNGTQPDRDWPALADLLPEWRSAFDAHMAGFDQGGPINRLRADILAHVRKCSAMTPGLFTLTVPTGGGKTLASLGFALDHAVRHGHRRIIFAIPYTSIIDQTAAIFRGLFGDAVLEHHSAIDDERTSPERKDKLRLAMEDWAAPLVVTTNVQFFESLFAVRPSRCRKLHNIAGSVIVLDEAQALPRKLLMPALRMIDTLCAHYGCSVVLCTATQPAFDSRQLKQGGLSLEGRELAPDPVRLARELRRARIVQGGEMDDNALIEVLRDTPQGMVIVNSRAHALDLFNAAKAEELEGLVHLTTRQYPVHRRAILEDIRARLKSGAPCRLIATSLIEAGVDLSFPKGWRAEAGLDSCVQAAGRVSRNGEWPVEDSTLTVFSAPGRPTPNVVRKLAEAMRSIAGRHDDLLSPAAIRDWFEHVYWNAGAARLGQPMVDRMILGRNGTDFPFRSMAEDFRMIETTMVPVIIPGDVTAVEAIRQLAVENIPSGRLARALQVYIVQVPAKARALLVEAGHASFHQPALRGDQFCVLESLSLYHVESGFWWERADYLAEEMMML